MEPRGNAHEHSDEEAATMRSIADEFGLEPVGVEGLSMVIGALEIHHRDGGFGSANPVIINELADVISMPVITDVLSTVAWDEPRLEPFLSDVAAGTQGVVRAGPLTVLAACAEARDDVLAAERYLRDAVAADPHFTQAGLTLALYEEERGDYAAALRLYRTTGIKADQEPRETLEGLAIDFGTGGARVGRNEPCPCGSGRKYKACHIDRLEVASLEPLEAVLRKLSHWQLLLGGAERLEQVEDEVRAGLDGAFDDVPLEDMLHTDVMLWDAGGLRHYLDVRGVLLPDSERALLKNWLLSRRALYAVTSVEPGSSVTLDEVDGGLEVRLNDRSLSRQLQPLDLFLTRLVPDGSGHITSLGGISVPRPQRQYVASLVAANDGIGLLRWLVDPVPTPHMQTMEGEELLFTTITYRLPDPGSTREALSKKLRMDRDDGVFREFVKRRGREWIRGSITVEGDVATIESNAKKRADRLERTLKKAAPGAVLLKRVERTLQQVSEEEGHITRTPDPRLDPATNPEVAAMMADVMRQMEESWVDEQIPALGGLTPRQAMGDPEWRKELEAMLDDMAWQNRQPGAQAMMDPARIRRLLE
jgi:SEC-C motif